jgi:hypothetical protein
MKQVLIINTKIKTFNENFIFHLEQHSARVSKSTDSICGRCTVSSVLTPQTVYLWA